MNEGTSNLLEYPVGFTSTTTPTAVTTTGSGATSVMINPRGDIIYSTGAAHIYSIQSGAGNFYGVPVGSTSAASNVSITYTFTVATTLGAVPATFTSNNSATPLFATSTLSGAPTTPLCTASKAYAAGATCILNVAFLPTQVGVATGSVSLISSTGAVLATTPLMGVGVGPAAGFSPGTQSTLLSSLGQPEGVAIDAGGNTYLADAMTAKVTKTASGGTTTALGFTGLAQPTGVAVDGMGSVYVSDTHNDAVYKLTSGGTQSTLATTGLNAPAGIAVDGFNNVYIADSGNARIVKITPAGVQSTLGFTGLTSPMWVAVDFSGDIFVSDSGKIYEYSALGVQTTVTTTGLGSPAGLAVAANGSLYIADTTNKDVYVLPYTGISGIPSYGTAFTLASGFTTPTGLAFSGAGVLTIADTGTRSVFVLDQTKQTLTFPPTAMGATSAPLTAKLQDIGNSSLALSGFTVSSSYAQSTPVNAATDCSATATVLVASSCNVNILFEPTSLGPVPGSVTLTDNALNGTSTTQTISLSGTGITATATTLAQTTPATGNPMYGSSVTVTATVAPASGSGTPTGSVSFYLDSSTTPATNPMSGGQASYNITGLTAGTHTVTATYSGDSNYAVSTSMSFTITVTPAVITVSAQAQTRQYGVANGPLVATYSGFQYSDGASVISGAPVLSTTATTTSDPAVYPISVAVGTLSAANYTFTAVNSTITVQQATNTINFPAIYAGNTVVYGALPVTPKATASSGLPITYSAIGNVTLSGGGTTFTINGTGPVTITANQAGNTDYAPATSATYSFTITPAVLTVTATNESKTQGSPNPTLGYTITGYQYSDTGSAVSGSPALTTTATTTSGTGTYPINCATGTLSATNYTFTCVNATLTITGTTPQTITFNTLPNVTYGAAAINLSNYASTNSNLALSYSVASSNATVSGSTLTIAGIGQVCVTASQAGNSTYAAATSVTQCFTVAPAALTVTPANVSIYYASPNPIPSSFQYTITGYQYADTSAVVSGVPAITTTAGANSAVGTYPITPTAGSLSAANYTFAFVAATLTIQADPQTITPTSLPNVTYGAGAINLSNYFSTNSGLTITYTVTTPQTASVSGSTLTILGAGTVSVTASQAGNATTAAATPVTQSFTVAPAPLTVTANNVTIAYGAAIPTSFSDTITGFVYSDTASVVSGQAANSTTATATSPGGTYPITPTIGTLTAANYTFPAANFVPGVLTISSVSQSITFPALPNIPQTTTSVQLAATASSGLPITYNVNSTVATVNNATGVLTITGPGTVSVTATQPGNSSYQAATPVTQTFTVTATTSTALKLSTTTTYPGISVTLTATITDTAKLSATPTGTVSFYAFTGTSAILLSTTPSTVSPTTGIATLTSSTLPSGNLSITAVYSGDANYTTSTSAAQSLLIIAPDFTVAASSTVLTTSSSTPAVTTITITPVGGYSNTVTYSCASLPSTLNCLFNPTAINFYPGTTVLTLPQNIGLTITYTPPMVMLHRPWERRLAAGSIAMAALWMGLLSFQLPWLSRRRRRLNQFARLAILIVGLTSFLGLSGCGTGASATPGTYFIPVVFNDGTTVTHTLTLTVTVVTP
jgi:sugar lactone lactonase YvrE